MNKPSTFKKGDRVRCVDCKDVDEYLTLGSTYEVASMYYDEKNRSCVVLKPYPQASFFESRFELAYGKLVYDKVTLEIKAQDLLKVHSLFMSNGISFIAKAGVEVPKSWTAEYYEAMQNVGLEEHKALSQGSWDPAKPESGVYPFLPEELGVSDDIHYRGVQKEIRGTTNESKE